MKRLTPYLIIAIFLAILRVWVYPLMAEPPGQIRAVPVKTTIPTRNITFTLYWPDGSTVDRFDQADIFINQGGARIFSRSFSEGSGAGMSIEVPITYLSFDSILEAEWMFAGRRGTGKVGIR